MAAGPSIRDFVSSEEEPVYAISGLPEEVVAVVFAYVSRSPASFRDNLRKLLAEDLLPTAPSPLPLSQASAKASRFHEKWVVGYGHASVAEHAVVHLGVEAVSRIASAELELASSFLSFTEFSQRYQRPRRGAYVTPPELPADLLAAYEGLQNKAYEVYDALVARLQAHHVRRGQTAHEAEKLAFEDARYALTLATETALGLTANARALREATVRLMASPYGEVRNLAGRLSEATKAVAPTLMRHLTPERPEPPALLPPVPEGQVVLEDYTGRGSRDPEEEALKALGLGSADEFPSLGPHALEPRCLDQVRYRVRFAVSEACWHQLLRHNRRTDFLYGPPEVAQGVVVPPSLLEVGEAGRLLELAAESSALFQRLQDAAPPAAAYAVLNAHRRLVRASLSLRQLVHIVRLRTEQNAQWEIRALAEELRRLAAKVHPRIVGQLLRELPSGQGVPGGKEA